MSRNTLVKSFNADGTVTIDGGRVMQVVMASNGALGLIEHTPEHVVSHLDQDLGIDRSPGVPPPNHFDTSALDQS